MSILQYLRNNGWKGDPNLALNRYNVIHSMQDLARNLNLIIVGSYAVNLYNEHYSTIKQSKDEYNVVDIFIEDEYDDIMKYFRKTFHIITEINKNLYRVDKSFTINIIDKIPDYNVILIKFWVNDADSCVIPQNTKNVKHHLSDDFNYSFFFQNNIK